MDKQALNDAYQHFVSTGYNGTIEDFSNLLSTDNEALNDSYNYFKSTGYNDSIEDFSNLVGVGKKTGVAVNDATVTSKPNMVSASETGSSDSRIKFNRDLDSKIDVLLSSKDKDGKNVINREFFDAEDEDAVGELSAQFGEVLDFEETSMLGLFGEKPVGGKASMSAIRVSTKDGKYSKEIEFNIHDRATDDLEMQEILVKHRENPESLNSSEKSKLISWQNMEKAYEKSYNDLKNFIKEHVDSEGLAKLEQKEQEINNVTDAFNTHVAVDVEAIEDKYSKESNPDLFEPVTKKVYSPQTKFSTKLHEREVTTQPHKEILKSAAKMLGTEEITQEVKDLAREILIETERQKVKEQKTIEFQEELADGDIAPLSFLKYTGETDELKNMITVGHTMYDKEYAVKTELYEHAKAEMEKDEDIILFDKLSSDLESKDFEIREGEETVFLQDGREVPRSIVEEYDRLHKRVDAKYGSFFKLQEDLIDQAYKISDVKTQLDLARRSYHDGEAFVAKTLAHGGKLYLGMGGVTENKYKISRLNKAHDKLDKFTNEYAPDIAFENAFDNPVNFGKFLWQETAKQASIMTTIAIPQVGTGVLLQTIAGQQYLDMTNENLSKEDKEQYSIARKLVTSYAFAAPEAIFERLTSLPLMQRAGGAIKGIYGSKFRDLTKEGLRNYGHKYTKSQIFAIGTLGESLGEGATTVTQNLITGRPWHEGLDHSMFSGLMFGGGFSSIPVVEGAVLRTLGDYESSFEIRENVKEIDSIAQTNKNLKLKFKLLSKKGRDKDGSKRKAILDQLEANKNKITEITNENGVLLKKQKESIVGRWLGWGNTNNEAGMTKGAFDAFLSVTQEQERLRTEAESVMGNDSYSTEVKTKKLQELKIKFDQLQAARDAYRGENKSEWGIVKADKKQKALVEKTIAAAKSKLRKEGNENYDEVTLDDTARIIYNTNKINKNLKTGKRTKLDKSLVVYQTVEEATNKMREEGVSENAIKNVEDGAHGFDNPKTDKSYIIVENMAKDDRLETKTHELSHRFLRNAISNDPRAFKDLSDAIINWAKDNDTALHTRLQRATERRGDGSLIEDEVIAVFLEEAAANRVKLTQEKGGFGGWLGFTASKIMEDKYGVDMDFAGESDAIKVLVGLGKKLKAGKLTLKEQKTFLKTDPIKELPKEAKKKTESKGKKPKETEAQKMIRMSKTQQQVDALAQNPDGSNMTKEQYDAEGAVNAYMDLIDGKGLDGIILTHLVKKGIDVADVNANVNGVPLDMFLERVREKLIPDILGFDPGKNVTGDSKFGLSGHINSRIAFRIGDAIKQERKEGPRASSIDERIGDKGDRTVADTIESEEDILAEFENLDLSVGSRDLVETSTELKSIYRHKLKGSDGKKLIKAEQTEAIREGVRETLVELGDNITTDKFLLKLEQKVKKKMKNIVQKEIGVKDDYKNFVIDNIGTIVEFTTIHDLVALERMVGKKYPDGKKIFSVEVKKNLNPTEVDKAIRDGKIKKDVGRRTGPSLYEKRTPTKRELEAFFFGRSGKETMQDVLGYTMGASTLGTRKDGLARMIITELAQDATMETLQEQAIIEEMIVKNPGVAADLIVKNVARSIDRSVDLKFSITADLNMLNAINGGDLSAYHSIKFSKKHRDSYINRLRKKRTDIKEEDLEKQVDNVYEFVDGLDESLVKKKSKFEKLAFHYLSNGFLILPEDGYKVIEAERLSSIKKIDPFSYKNPNELINKFVGEVKGKRINPDEVVEFSNKKELVDNVTVYDVEDSKAGQIAVRKVIDTHFGKKSNPWCLAARQEPSTGGGVVDYWAEQDVYWSENMEFSSIDDFTEAKEELEKDGHTTHDESYMSKDGKVYGLSVSYNKDLPHPIHGVRFNDAPNEVKEDRDELSNAWKMWKMYNSNGNGYGFKIAFQNGKLIAFRDGDLKEWWDVVDRPTKGIPIRTKEKDGVVSFNELNTTSNKVKLTHKEKGDKSNGKWMKWDDKGNIVGEHNIVNGGFVGRSFSLGEDGIFREAFYNEESVEHGRYTEGRFDENNRRVVEFEADYVDGIMHGKVTKYMGDKTVVSYYSYGEFEDGVIIRKGEKNAVFKNTVIHEGLSQAQLKSFSVVAENVNIDGELFDIDGSYLTKPGDRRSTGIMGNLSRYNNGAVLAKGFDFIVELNVETLLPDGLFLKLDKPLHERGVLEYAQEYKNGKIIDKNVSLDKAKEFSDDYALDIKFSSKESFKYLKDIIKKHGVENVFENGELKKEYINKKTPKFIVEEFHYLYMSRPDLFEDISNKKILEEINSINNKVGGKKTLGDLYEVVLERRAKAATKELGVKVVSRGWLVKRWKTEFGESINKKDLPDLLIWDGTKDGLMVGIESKVFPARGGSKSFNEVSFDNIAKGNFNLDWYLLDKHVEDGFGKEAIESLAKSIGDIKEYLLNKHGVDLKDGSTVVGLDADGDLGRYGSNLKAKVKAFTTIDSEFIHDYYSDGETKKIKSKILQVEGKGAFYLGDFDPRLEKIGIPRLSGEFELSVRLTPRRVTSDYKLVGKRYGLRLEVQLKNADLKGEVNGKIVDKSALSIDNRKHFVKVLSALKLSKNTKNQILTNNLNTALDNSRDVSKFSKSKGISVFDFDETVGLSENFIFASRGDEKKKITSHEWPLVGETLKEQGWEFDFSDFNKVTKGKPGPLMQKLKNQIRKYGVDNVYILTARAPESELAIHEWLKTQGVELPVENITGLGNSTGQAKADWMIEKYAEGYNDMYFVDDALSNVKAVQKAFDVLDIKGKSIQARMKFSKNMKQELHDMLERNKGVATKKQFSEAIAKHRGKNIGKYEFFISAGADDFQGLMMRLEGKGKQGEADRAWFRKALVNPYNRAYKKLNKAKYDIITDFGVLTKDMPGIKKLLKKDFNDVFTNEQAVRIYSWHKAGFEVPGLTEKEVETIAAGVAKDKQLVAFANRLGKLMRTKEGYLKPEDHWTVQTITSDLHNVVEKVHRPIALKEWQDNVDLIFDSETLNKLEAVMGSSYASALKDILWRMKTGKNRPTGQNADTNKWLNWVNNSVGAIMFFNSRSAVLQLLSTVNYINWEDNNPMKAAKAFANQKQFWTDFAMIFNSPMLKVRRSGLQTDVNQAELADAVHGSSNKASAALSYLLKIGFSPTQIADSFAISMGGSAFYRNRVKKYLSEGMAQKVAEEKAFSDFQEITEENQQSSRPDRVSQQQASPLGRLILAFQNTPMQYNRLIKKSALDLVNGRGDKKTHISKIMYYGIAQGLVFYGLQNALFALMFDDEDDDRSKKEKKKDKQMKLDRITNGLLDSLLRGSGLKGAVASTVKNSFLKFMEENDKSWNADYGNVLVEALNISPPIGSKARKIYTAFKNWKYNKKVISEMDWYDLDNPAWMMGASLVEGVTNVPTYRLLSKIDNMKEAANSENAAWQRMAVALGWNQWSVGIDPYKESKKVKKKISKREARKKKKKKRRRHSPIVTY